MFRLLSHLFTFLIGVPLSSIFHHRVLNFQEHFRERKCVLSFAVVFCLCVQQPFWFSMTNFWLLRCWHLLDFSFGKVLVLIFFLRFVYFFLICTQFLFCISMLGFLDLQWIFACLLSVFDFLTLARLPLLELFCVNCVALGPFSFHEMGSGYLVGLLA